jgi:dienelactone hydrolase
VRSAAVVAILAAFLSGGCGNSASSSPTAPSPSGATSASLNLQGDPESSQGASWTYRGALAGINVDLQGILLKPRGSGPFPAVIMSHGVGGNAIGTRGIAVEMVQWGLVCIATNYTHAGGVPLGAPGGLNEPGASQANVLRAHDVYEILRLLGYVDMRRVAAHGHSAGAFVTTALIATYPNDFRAASHTAGGVRPDAVAGAGAPSEGQARGIRTPYQLHHGDADSVIPVSSDQRLANVLQAGGVSYELHVYPGAEHNDVARDAAMFARVRAWYASHGVF